MYDPFRLVIDVESADAGAPTPTATPARADAPRLRRRPSSLRRPSMAMSAKSKEPASAPPPPADPPAPARTGGTPVAGTPVPPSSNRSGEYSLSRQLGLGVSRIVVDAGHGGHDPGAQANGIDESELTLDVAQRLQKLLEAQPGFAVVLTRSTDDYIALEERTAIANREGADLFLSIHANASRQTSAQRHRDVLPELRDEPDGRSGGGARERVERSEHGHAARHPEGDRAQQQARGVARARVDRADVARAPAGPAEQDDSRPRREAGAVRRAHRRADAEHPGGDLVPDEPERGDAAQAAGLPAAHRAGPVRRHHEVSGLAEEGDDRRVQGRLER